MVIKKLRSPRACLWPLILVSLACEAPEAEPLTFRYHLEASPSSLDPARVNDTYSLGVADRLFDSLMRLDPIQGLPELEMAASYSVSTDGRVYEFRIRSDARFHNERPVEAADFKYSWQRLLDPAAPSPRAWLLERVIGAEAFQSGQAETVSGIEVVAPNILRVHLTQPHEFFLSYLASPAATAVPREEVERLGESFGQQPMGSGPYQFWEWVPGLRIELAAFDSHGIHKPQARRLIYEVVPEASKALEMYFEDRLDLVTSLPNRSFRRLQTEYPAEVRVLPIPNWSGFCFRTDRPPFDDFRIRRALALAVDREHLVCELGEGENIAGFGLLPQGIPGHDPANLGRGYDLAQSKALLAEAGYPDGAEIPAVTYAMRSADHSKTLAEALVSSWAELDISTEYRMMDLASLLRDAKLGQWDLFHRGWISSIPDPELFLRPLFHSQGKANYSAYANPEVDRLLDAAHSELDPTARLELYSQAEAIVIAEAPCVALYHGNEVILLSARWRDIPLGLSLPGLEIERARYVEEGM